MILSNKRFFRAASEKDYLLPSGEKIKFDEKTFERLFYSYRKNRFDYLRPRDRNDKGRVRKLDNELIGVALVCIRTKDIIFIG